MLMQNFGDQMWCIMGNVEVAYEQGGVGAAYECLIIYTCLNEDMIVEVVIAI